MLGSFFAPQEKIARARKHLAELETEISAYITSRPIYFDTKVIDKPGSRRFEFMMNMRLPGPLFSAIVGDVIHNLRAALDVAACDLVRWNEGAADTSVGDVKFPICKSAKNFDSIIRKGALNRMGVEAVNSSATSNPIRPEIPSCAEFTTSMFKISMRPWSSRS
jgi:hypothetical protein